MKGARVKEKAKDAYRVWVVVRMPNPCRVCAGVPPHAAHESTTTSARTPPPSSPRWTSPLHHPIIAHASDGTWASGSRTVGDLG